ncbi:hypothetical protein OG799_10775 [Micromonospora sp. NBC_00898]|nr:hypothetical protein OG799_10775 [Micromonospora sp. NBC_00898]
MSDTSASRAGIVGVGVDHREQVDELVDRSSHDLHQKLAVRY